MELDLSKYDNTNHDLLQKEQKSKLKVAANKTEAPVKKEKKKVEEDKGPRGRPLMANEVLSKPVTVNFTESEKEMLLEKAAGVTLSTYLRKQLKDAKVI